jgi:hypothetical protein
MKDQVSAGVEAAEPAPALWGFGVAWRSATEADHDDSQNESTADVFEMALSGAIASNDVAETGRLLMSKDVNRTRIKARNLPAKLLRQPATCCPVLDVAVGSGAVEVAKTLLEFHEAKATRETLKAALSSGSFELVRICWERLPDGQEKGRLDLLEVAADFHQPEVLSWLFRDADKFAKELFVDFAIRRHLADAGSGRGVPSGRQRSGRRCGNTCSVPPQKASGRTAAGSRTRKARLGAFVRCGADGLGSRRSRGMKAK